MATSTEATVRGVIATAIRGIADQLGFDEVGGNVREYPLEMHQATDLPGYLMAKVGGKQVVQCWAVDVRAHDLPYALQQIPRRTYAIRVFAYYAKGVNGESYLKLIDHGRLIRGQIKLLSNSLSNTVNRIVSATPLDISERTGLDVDRTLQGLMTYSCDRENPDF
jgi:hypothetical protein